MDASSAGAALNPACTSDGAQAMVTSENGRYLTSYSSKSITQKSSLKMRLCRERVEEWVITFPHNF